MSVRAVVLEPSRMTPEKVPPLVTVSVAGVAVALLMMTPVVTPPSATPEIVRLVPLRSRVPLTVRVPVPTAEALPTARVPALLMVVPPEYVLAPDRVRVPPLTVKAVVLMPFLMMPANVPPLVIVKVAGSAEPLLVTRLVPVPALMRPEMVWLKPARS